MKDAASPPRSRRTASAVLITVALTLALLLPGLGRAPFDDPGEGMHVEIAREVLVTRDWLTLHLNGVRYFDKPPLLYWLVAASTKISGGVDRAVGAEATARMAPLAGAVAAVAGTAYLGARLMSAEAGVLAGVALLTCPGFVAYATYVRPETLFVAALQWGLALLLVARTPTSAVAIAGYVALAVAAIAKDPIGALGPLIAILVARIPFRGHRRPTPIAVTGVLVLVALAGLWYVAVELVNPGFLWYTFVDNHLLNAAHVRHFPDEDVPLTAIEFATVASLGAFPWIVPAIGAVIRLARERAWRDDDEAPWVTLAVWAVGMLAFFIVLPFKLPHYGLPVYPALALLAARSWITSARPARLAALHVVLFAALAIVLGWAATTDGRVFLGPVLETTDVYTRKEAAIGQPTPFPSWAALRPLAAGSAAIFAAGALALSIPRVRRARTAAIVVTAITLLGWVPFVARASALVAGARSVKTLAREIGRLAGPDDLVVHEGPIENSGALELYGGRRPVLLDGRTSVLGFGATFPDARDTFWDRARLIATWRSPRRVLLLTIRDPANSVVADLRPSEVVLVAVGGGRWLYTNRP